MRHMSVAPVAQHASVIDTSGNPDSCLCGACFNIGPGQPLFRPGCPLKATSKGFSRLFDGATVGGPRPSY